MRIGFPTRPARPPARVAEVELLLALRRAASAADGIHSYLTWPHLRASSSFQIRGGFEYGDANPFKIYVSFKLDSPREEFFVLWMNQTAV